MNELNLSAAILLRGQIEWLRRSIDATDELDSPRHLHDLADAAERLAATIRDRIGHPADEYLNASKGHP